jgi:hypothetical protein
MIAASYKKIAIPNALREIRLVASRTVPPRNAKPSHHEPREYRKSDQPPVLAEETLIWYCQRKPDDPHPRQNRTDE